MAKKKSVKNAKSAAMAKASGVGTNGNGNVESYDYHAYSSNSNSGNKTSKIRGGIPFIWKCFAVIVAFIAISRDKLWPWGIASEIPNSDRSNYAQIDYTNDSLMSKRRSSFCMPSIMFC